MKIIKISRWFGQWRIYLRFVILILIMVLPKVTISFHPPNLNPTINLITLPIIIPIINLIILLPHLIILTITNLTLLIHPQDVHLLLFISILILFWMETCLLKLAYITFHCIG